MKILKSISLGLFLLSLLACNSGPEVIEADAPATGADTPPMFKDPGAMGGAGSAAPAADIDAAVHTIVAEEVLNTDKYTYVRGKEDGQEIWIAVLKQEVKIGDTYAFRGGLMKKNFQSKEYNRTFETLYLVSDFRAEGAAGASASGSNPHANVQRNASVEAPTNVTLAAGAVKIADLVANLKKYEGKTVKVTGKVMKVNPMIMGRNWLHLQDGSGKGLDLTVTTVEQVQLGQTVTMEGTLTLNKDFGAGYKYDYIVESAVVKK